jgi:6-phosphofructokinase 1
MAKPKRILVLTGGGDCPGLNAVIRGIVKKATGHLGWQVVGSIDGFNGVLLDPMELKDLDLAAVSGIHIRGGTIIGTTNRGGPFHWPVKQPDGTWSYIDRSADLLRRLRELEIDAVVNIGGDGSQKISQQLFEMGLAVVGVPKTIDNDLSSTDFAFGYQTAVEIATDGVDKLVTTASSHSRIMVMEVMGRDAGWIALGAAVAGGADVVLLPEIPFSMESVSRKIAERTRGRRGFAIVVVSEGAYPKDGQAVSVESTETGYSNRVMGGVGRLVAGHIRTAFPDVDVRVTVLGHLQRGGSPCAFDRILATSFGVAAVDLIQQEKFGHMVSYRHPNMVAIPIAEAIARYNFVDLDSHLVKTARGLGICLGD